MLHQYVRRAGLALGAWLLTAWAHAAWAFPATVTDIVHLRAGPSVAYPSVALLGRGSTVEVFGCEQGWGWCDVAIGRQRGWVDAFFLMAQGPSGPVVVANNGLVLGLTVTPFIFNTYWGAHYRGMPWWGRRDYYFRYWNRWPHGRPPPPPRRPPMVRPPPPRPMPTPRPPPGARPPPSTGRPPTSGRPPPSQTRPATQPAAQPQSPPPPR